MLEAIVGLAAGVGAIFTMALNFLGGIAAGIWLAVLGEWWAIGLGILALFVAQFVIGIALLPVVGLGSAAGWMSERDFKVGVWLFGFLSSLYVAALLTVWCVGILDYFLARADAGSWIPLLIWSYGVATGPWAWMAQKEMEGGGGEGSVVAVFSAQVGYVAMMIAVALGEPSLVTLTIIFGAIMFLGVTANTVAAAVSSQKMSSIYELEG